MGITDLPSFCVLPWIHLNLSPDGAASLCCHSPAAMNEGEHRLNAQTYTLREIWESNALKDVRRRMAGGERIAQCGTCWHNERFSGTSFRAESNKRWLDGNPALRAAIESAENWAAPGDPLYLDLRLGNLCNLKCTICKPLYSSQIERDPVHARWNTDAPHSRFPSRFAESEWWRAGALVDEIVDMSAPSS